jgi:arylsulfatase A-like enzyme
MTGAPNVVAIVVDNVGRENVARTSCLGPTPRIDAVAERLGERQ